MGQDASPVSEPAVVPAFAEPANGTAAAPITGQFAVLLAIIVAAPLPLGGNRPWAIAVLGAAIFALLVHHLLKPEGTGANGEGGRSADAPWQRARTAWWAMAGWVALLAAQLVPLPTAWVVGLRSGLDPAWTDMAGPWTRITVDAFSTRLYLLKAITLLAFFALLLRLATSERRVELLAKAVVVSGVVQALLGLSLFALGARYSLFFVSIEHSSVTGTFVNHNHFAGYLEMALAVGIGLMIAKLDGRQARSWRLWVRNWLAVLVSDKARLRIMLVVMVIALIGSRSRMGNGAFLLSLLAVGAFAIVAAKRSPRSMVIFIASLLILDIAIIGSLVGVERVVQRIHQTQLLSRHAGFAPHQHAPPIGEAAPAGTSVAGPAHRADGQESIEQRTEAARQALAMVHHFPAMGTGGGTFHMAFVPFRTPELPGYFDHVHNDFAEILVETGALGFALLACTVCVSAFHASRMLVVRRSPFARGMGFASLMGIAALMLHSMVDFNLQIPANAMLFLVVLALPYLVGSQSRRRSRSLEIPMQTG